MAKGREERRGTRIDRCYRLAAILAAGEALDRDRVASVLGIGKANADRHLRAIETNLTVDVSAGRGGIKVLRATKKLRKAAPRQTVVAACFGAMLARLFADTSFEARLRGLVHHVLDDVRDHPKYKHSERQFWFVSRGGERALRKNGGEILATLVDAILDRRWVRMTRKTFGGKTERTRVKPLSLVLHEHQLYLLAMGEDAQLNNIRFARVSTVLTLKETFEYPSLEDFDPRLVFRDSIGIFIHDDPAEQISIQHVKIRLHKRWASYVETHRWHETQKHRIQDGGVILELHVRTCRELDKLILGFGEDAEVLEPAWLRDRIAHRVEGMANRYR
jgi:predicted DNA-binding transcriptional regulator YafY